LPGCKKRVPLFDEDGNRIRGIDNKKAAHLALARVKLGQGWLPEAPPASPDDWIVAKVCSKYLQYCERGAANGTLSPARKREAVEHLQQKFDASERPACEVDHVWTWDFVFDRTSNGTTLKWLSIVDEHTRECLALKVARSITSEDVIDTLAELFAMRGMPRCVRSDNGPEFIAQVIGHWFAKTSVTSLYIEPRAPWENGYAESFHSRLRDDLLGLHAFADLREARTLTAAWREDYNHRRPHSSLGYQTPAGFAAGVPTPFGLRPHSVGTPGRARNHYLLPNP